MGNNIRTSKPTEGLAPIVRALSEELIRMDDQLEEEKTRHRRTRVGFLYRDLLDSKTSQQLEDLSDRLRAKSADHLAKQLSHAQSELAEAETCAQDLESQIAALVDFVVANTPCTLRTEAVAAIIARKEAAWPDDQQSDLNPDSTTAAGPTTQEAPQN
jgi:Rod binding domain-containing protein